MLCAVATDDGIHLMGRHFGDAARYDLYLLDKEEIIFKKIIVNPFREDEENEDLHEDKKKARNMKELFLERGVSVLVSKAFGPNVKRMVKNFVPVVVRHNDIKKAKKLLVKYFDKIEQMFKCPNRKPVILK